MIRTLAVPTDTVAAPKVSAAIVSRTLPLDRAEMPRAPVVLSVAPPTWTLESADVVEMLPLAAAPEIAPQVLKTRLSRMS